MIGEIERRPLKGWLGLIWKNFYLEVLVLGAAIGLGLSGWPRKMGILTALDGYFSGDRTGDVVAFFSLAIGIYLAIVSILATASLPVGEEIEKFGGTDAFIVVSCGCLIEALFIVAWGIFGALWEWYSWYFAALVAMGFLSLVRFVWLIVCICRINMRRNREEALLMRRREARFLTDVEQVREMLKDWEEERRSSR